MQGCAEFAQRLRQDIAAAREAAGRTGAEHARLHVDAFLQKGLAPTVVLDKIRELLTLPRQAA